MKKLYVLASGLLVLGLNAQTKNLQNALEGTPKTVQVADIASKGPVDVLYAEDFETFTVGAAVGQNGYAYAGGTPADYQIKAADAAHSSKYLTIGAAGGTAATASVREFAESMSTLYDAWDGRAADNNILRGTLDFYTGTSTNIGAGRAGSYIFDADGNGVIGINWNAAEKTFHGFIQLRLKADGEVGGYNVSWGATMPKFNADTWYKVEYMYDYTTGDGWFKMPNGTTYTWDNASNTTVEVVPGVYPDIHEFVAFTNVAASRTYGYDNAKLVAGNAVNLAVSTVKGQVSTVQVYPNPTADVLNVTNTKKLNAYRILDASGKVVSSGTPAGTSIDVSKLAKGAYVIHFETLENGFETRKFIKK